MKKENQTQTIEPKRKDFVLNFNGGIGKIICATSFVKWLKEKYPEQQITVISPWPEIFEYNPRIYRNIPPHQAYLYEDYIKGKDYRLGEPYALEEYYREENKMHLSQLFPKAYGFNEYNLDPEMEFFITQGEAIEAEGFKNQGPPVFSIQMTGGVPQGTMPNNQKADFDQRDMKLEMANRIAQNLLQRGFRVVQVGQPQETPIQIPGVLRPQLPFRRFVCLAPMITGHIGIDSSMMHACAIFKIPQLIFFGQTHKDNLGYKYEGFFAKSKPEGMFCRPHVGIPDNGGIYPYRDSAEKTAMEWSSEELNQAIDEFIKYIIDSGRLKQLYPNMHFHAGGTQNG